MKTLQFLSKVNSQLWLTRESELSSTKQNLRKEETRLMFPLDLRMLIALGMITVTSLTM